MNLMIVAQTGNRFADFAPYVPCIDPRGRVAFQAALTAGGTGVFAGEEDTLYEVAGDVLEVVSHPVFIGEDAVFYARTLSGTALYSARRGALTVGMEAGPLGPTANSRGEIGFRADGGIHLFRDGAGVEVARRGERFADFQGLPLALADGSVVFRADLADGGQGLYRWQQGEIATLAETGEQFTELGRFPCANASGTVAFAAVERSGHSGIFTPHFTVGGAFTFRGALIDDLNRVIAFATPIGGELGIYADGGRLIGVGDDFEGSTVAEFALNPVSINGAGQFAARLKLSDDRQFIVRFDDWATES